MDRNGGELGDTEIRGTQIHTTNKFTKSDQILTSKCMSKISKNIIFSKSKNYVKRRGGMGEGGKWRDGIAGWEYWGIFKNMLYTVWVEIQLLEKIVYTSRFCLLLQISQNCR